MIRSISAVQTAAIVSSGSALGRFRLEFTFLSKKLRGISNKRELADKALGEDLAEAYLSTLADLRGATVLGELPDEPTVSPTHERNLWIPIARDTFVEIEPTALLDVSGVSWKSAHRVKVRRILKGGETLA